MRYGTFCERKDPYHVVPVPAALRVFSSGLGRDSLPVCIYTPKLLSTLLKATDLPRISRDAPPRLCVLAWSEVGVVDLLGCKVPSKVCCA